MSRRALLMGRKKGELPLVLEIDTTKTGVTPSTDFQIPANAIGETYSYRVDWGDGTKTDGHTGVASHTYLTGGVYQVKIYGEFPRMYFNNGGDRQKLIKVLNWGEINYSTNQVNAFYGCVNLEFIATDTLNAWYNNITNGFSMFYNNSLTSLPDGMTLASLTNGNNMFSGNSLTSLPVGMTLSSLMTGSNMFQNNSITSLPDSMTLANLTTGTSMFRSNSLTSLPDEMTLASLTTGSNMFNGSTINTARYSQLLIDLEALNPNNNVTFHAGNSKYNSSAVTARAALTGASRNWTITDGGLE